MSYYLLQEMVERTWNMKITEDTASLVHRAIGNLFEELASIDVTEIDKIIVIQYTRADEPQQTVIEAGAEATRFISGDPV